jgi:hypothetical protein
MQTSSFSLTTAASQERVWQRLSDMAILMEMQDILGQEPHLEDGRIVWGSASERGQLEVKALHAELEPGTEIAVQLSNDDAIDDATLETRENVLRSFLETQLQTLNPSSSLQDSPGGMRAYGLVAERGAALEPGADAPGGMSSYGVVALEADEPSKE